ncbi:DUF2584 family protein [Phormidesmis sp. 146-12]
MGMPCQVNSILKLNQDYPSGLTLDATHQATKPGYRIFAIDVPIPLVDDHWNAYADVIIEKLTWQQQETHLTFRISRIYTQPFALKS